MDSPFSRLRVLVVEDEALILMLLEGMLFELGCKDVERAASVGEALVRVGERQFDLAILDKNLGGVDSVAVADALAHVGVPFVYCTGNIATDTGVGDGDRPVLRKPFSATQLAGALSRLIQGSST